MKKLIVISLVIFTMALMIGLSGCESSNLEAQNPVPQGVVSESETTTLQQNIDNLRAQILTLQSQLTDLQSENANLKIALDNANSNLETQVNFSKEVAEKYNALVTAESTEAGALRVKIADTYNSMMVTYNNYLSSHTEPKVFDFMKGEFVDVANPLTDSERAMLKTWKAQLDYLKTFFEQN